MLIFKCGLVLLSSTLVLSVCFQVAKESNSLDIGLGFLYIASGAIALKIIYDRYQQVHILGSLTTNPNVTSFANRIASISASILCLGCLVYFFLFVFKVDDHCLAAISIFICGFGTLYMWMQCIITTYIATLFYDQWLSILRQFLANLSFLIVVVMAVFGTATTFMPKSSTGLYVCFLVTSLCSYLLAAIFCVFILSFEKEYQYFAEGLRSDQLLDEASISDASLSDVDSIYDSHVAISSAMLIKGAIGCGNMS